LVFVLDSPFFWFKIKIMLDKLNITFIIIIMNNLEEILYQKRITKAELARQLKITPQRINNWVNGKNYPKRIIMKQISDYLNIPIDKLFFEEDK